MSSLEPERNVSSAGDISRDTTLCCRRECLDDSCMSWRDIPLLVTFKFPNVTVLLQTLISDVIVFLSGGVYDVEGIVREAGEEHPVLFRVEVFLVSA